MTNPYGGRDWANTSPGWRHAAWLSAFFVHMLAAMAPVEAASKHIFQCRLGAKTARVTQEGEALVLHYGRPMGRQTTIFGTATNGRVHRLFGRYAGPLTQLRFSDGRASYIVYSMASLPLSGGRPIAGVIVVNGAGKMVANQSCARFAEFAGDLSMLDALPEDHERYSAMSL